ncbi:hypothetical protein Cs7R123_56120 [Catellatospora sp. TT07R-123]|uniref:hypothetical protein n=1 Tax=Catellatospora sp. TT07R-123 TaxID=2733863 RepID=UPI001AFED615|nr:hypothetical protein [Catellatospora sp. TT07R-123]GHJ48270.1 hypothetical protein Cs7R123_56120 [Catellatospora sp. TT07R-123]
MSELTPDYRVPADPDARPRSVSAAAWLLAGVGAAYLSDVVLLIAGAGSYPDRVAEAVRRAGVDAQVTAAMRSLATGMAVMVIAVTLIAAVVMFALAAAVRGRSRTGRVLTWIAGGLALLCGVCAGGSSGTPAFSGIAYVNAWSNTASGVHRFAQRLPDGYPPYYKVAATVLGAFSLLALIAVTILLARRESGDWFRKPVPAATHPGYPAYHPAPVAPAPQAYVPPQAQTPPPAPAPAPEPPRQRTVEEIELALTELDVARVRGDVSENDYMAQVSRLRDELRDLDLA